MRMRTRALKRHRDDGKVEHARLFVAIDKIFPAPENAKLYRPIDSNDPDIIPLADSIKRYGVREPLVISRDNFSPRSRCSSIPTRCCFWEALRKQAQNRTPRSGVQTVERAQQYAKLP
ncbi:MAG: hypothetical protein DME72_07930 [Verrucomicrobia bacterium]|nr:MAG: hypothetical protein DME72_07930 [Verrucomicrobiota bacterium]